MMFASRSPHSPAELLEVFESALGERDRFPARSSEIARLTFTTTQPNTAIFKPSIELMRIRDEFGALEAPGASDDDALRQEDYEDDLWRRLSALVKQAREQMEL